MSDIGTALEMAGKDPRYEPSKIGRVSSGFSSFRQGVKVVINHKRIIQLP